jgi:hypothetical protein
MFWLLLAAQLSMPMPVNTRVPDVRAIFTADDFPAYLLQAGVSRTVYTRTTVRPDGTVQSCAAEFTSGDSVLDDYTCALIVKRAKFRSGTWMDGSPVYGVMRFPVRWSTSAGLGSDPFNLPDLEISVNQLPKGGHSPVAVILLIAADENGHVMSCMELPALRNDRTRHFAELIPVACDAATKNLSLRAPSDATGKAVRSVQTASVQFKLDH